MKIENGCCLHCFIYFFTFFRYPYILFVYPKYSDIICDAIWFDDVSCYHFDNYLLLHCRVSIECFGFAIENMVFRVIWWGIEVKCDFQVNSWLLGKQRKKTRKSRTDAPPSQQKSSINCNPFRNQFTIKKKHINLLKINKY